jgi:hypothetical protein
MMSQTKTVISTCLAEHEEGALARRQRRAVGAADDDANINFAGVTVAEIRSRRNCVETAAGPLRGGVCFVRVIAQLAADAGSVHSSPCSRHPA